MMEAYNFPTKLATKLFLSIQKSETKIFNRNILKYYTVADELERECALKGPNLIVLYLRYTKYGLVGCGTFFQE